MARCPVFGIFAAAVALDEHLKFNRLKSIMTTITAMPTRRTTYPLRSFVPVSLLIALLSMLLGTATASEKLMLHLPLEGADREIVEVNDATVGLHFPTSVADQDDQDSLNADRYRVEGRYGSGIRYFADDRSYTRIRKADFLGKSQRALAISLEVKIEDAEKSRIAVLATNRTDSDKSGFSLFKWGNKLRFTFGDGNQTYQLSAPAQSLDDGNWHSVQAGFQEGLAALWLDDTRLTTKNLGAAKIAPSGRDLFLGGYPIDNRGRTNYAFDGRLDEVAFGGTQAPLVAYLGEYNKERSNLPPPPPIRANLLPVDGNEVFFEGERVFHSFRDVPLPITFLFESDKARLSPGEPSLVLYVPEDLELVVAHQSNHNEMGGEIPLDEEAVSSGGKTWTRYSTTEATDLTNAAGKRRGWKRGPFVSVAFKPKNGSVDEAIIKHALAYDGAEHQMKELTIRFIDDPEPVGEGERGDFEAFAYFISPAWVYPDRAYWDPMLDMLSNIGMTGRGRFYGAANGAFRPEFDRYARQRGFTLYEIGLWQGPKPYAMAVAPEATIDAYVSSGRRMGGLVGDEPVVFDYEPWRITYKNKSFTPEVMKRFAEFANLAEIPDRDATRSELRREWTDFWLNVGNNVYRAMGELVRQHHPDPEALRVSYTYFFPYNDEDALYRRFWSVPKDPRRAEDSDHVDIHLISLYHTNDRELVDQTRLSQAHLDRPIWGISALGRVNPAQNFATPDNSLFPEHLEQKFVLTAALGMRRQGIWPGRGWVDAVHLDAIGRATRFIWAHEEYYFGGEPVHRSISVSAANARNRNDWAFTAHRKDGKTLVTLFNFTEDRELKFKVPTNSAGTEMISVAPRDYATVLY